MRSNNFHSTMDAPSPEILRRARIAARLRVSPAMADVLAGFAYGACWRNDVIDLAVATTLRTEGRAHG